MIDLHLNALKMTLMPFGMGVLATLADPGVIATDAIVGWIIRAILGALIAVGAWILRDAAKTLKETHAEQAALKAIVASHQVMFEHWLDSLVEHKGEEAPGMINPGRRKSDAILRDLIESRQQNPKRR